MCVCVSWPALSCKTDLNHKEAVIWLNECLWECFYRHNSGHADLIPPREAPSHTRQTVYVSPLCHNPFSSPSLHFLGWTKHIVLTHHCLIMLELTGTPELWSTGLPRGFFLTPHCYRTIAATRGQPAFDSARTSIFLHVGQHASSTDYFGCYESLSVPRFPVKYILKGGGALQISSLFQHTETPLSGLFGRTLAPVKNVSNWWFCSSV